MAKSEYRNQLKTKPVIKINTAQEQWVVPHNCEYLKLLIQQENLRAADLKFATRTDCQGFIRQLFLLALQDEYRSSVPSTLASFARELARQQLHQTIL